MPAFGSIVGGAAVPPLQLQTPRRHGARDFRSASAPLPGAPARYDPVAGIIASLQPRFRDFRSAPASERGGFRLLTPGHLFEGQAGRFHFAGGWFSGRVDLSGYGMKEQGGIFLKLLQLMRKTIPSTDWKTFLYIHMVYATRKFLRSSLTGPYWMDHVYKVIREFQRFYKGNFSILEFGVAKTTHRCRNVPA